MSEADPFLKIVPRFYDDGHNAVPGELGSAVFEQSLSMCAAMQVPRHHAWASVRSSRYDLGKSLVISVSFLQKAVSSLFANQ